MPIPRRQYKETRQDFLERCMNDETMKKEYPNEKQRLAVCAYQYRV